MRPALLLIDLQEDFLAAAELQPAREFVVLRAARLLADWRRAGLPVIHVRTALSRADDRRLPHWRAAGRWSCERGSAGHAAPAELRELAHEPVIDKAGFNAFAGGELERALAAERVDTLVLAGLYLHACVRTAAQEALERQLGVYIAEDAVGSDDPVHAAATRRWLEQRAVVFAASAGIAERLGAPAPRALERRSPRRSSEALFELPIASAAEIEQAVAAAHAAAARWRRVPLEQRCAPFERVLARIEAGAPELARRLALEIGKPLAQGLEELRNAALNVRDVLRRARTEPLERVEHGARVRREPLGAIALISPWNNPIGIPLGKLAPALVFGNTVVWKPAPAGHALAETLLAWLREAGLPGDALSIAGGDAGVARQLAAARELAALTVTSSARAGHELHELCARRMLPFQAELSGNNAAIVWADADLRAAAAEIARGAFASAGQRCTANRRAIVHTRVLERFLRELERASEALVWGDPLDARTEIGPLIERERRDELEALLARAAAGTRALRVRRTHARQARESWVEAGAYAAPAIVECTDPAHWIAQEELMAPVLVVQPAADLDEALALCNGVRHGLVAALFGGDAGVQRAFLDEARAGLLKIGISTAGVDVRLPFGGWKASGAGPPEHGEADRLFYTRLQVVQAREASAAPATRLALGAGETR